MDVRAPNDRARVAELAERLDVGESEAIALALGIRADLLLIDEADGRDVAQGLGVPRIGLLGVLLEAKSRGLISSAPGELDQLTSRTSFRLHKSVRDEFLRRAGEGPLPVHRTADHLDPIFGGADRFRDRR